MTDEHDKLPTLPDGDLDWNAIERRSKTAHEEYERDAQKHARNPFVRVTHPYDAKPTPEQMRLDAWRWTVSGAFPERALHVAWQPETTAAIQQLELWAQRNPLGGIAALSGDVGCGKTVAATWLALRVRNKRFAPVCIRASELARLSLYSDDDVQRWRAPQFLVLDDLAAESTTVHVLDELVDVFYSDLGRILIITTNLDSKAFAKRYTRRVADRIRSFKGWLAIEGESMRGRP